MWVGDPPVALHKLTFAENLLITQHYPRCYVFKLYPKDGSCGHHPAHLQWAMAGNMTLYEVNTSAIASMLEGLLMPQGISILSSVLAITFIGTWKLPNDWMARTFRVRREAVYEALQWLHKHNKLCHNVNISQEWLALLPEDQIPEEVEALVRYEEDETVGIKEWEGCVMEDIRVGEGQYARLRRLCDSNTQLIQFLRCGCFCQPCHGCGQ